MNSATLTTFATLVALAGCERPTHNQYRLEAIRAEAMLLMATHPIDPAKGWLDLPKSELPPAIAGLKPAFVILDRRRVAIVTKPFFDGGWGYEVPRSKSDLGMPIDCYSEPGKGVFWHGPC